MIKKVRWSVTIAVVFFMGGCGGNIADIKTEDPQMQTFEEETAGQEVIPPEEEIKEEEYMDMEDPGIYALFQVSHSNERVQDIIIELFPEEAPNTAENFIGLASGQKQYRDPQTGQWTTGRFYDGLTFHRVIPGFMIQGGDPMGTGRGGPGYQFDCEISPELTFDRAGRLAMANAGPDTNGSQFFITVAPTPWLNGNHTIFGQVVEGMEAVVEISKVQSGPGDRPVETVTIKKVKIIDNTSSNP